MFKCFAYKEYFVVRKYLFEKKNRKFHKVILLLTGLTLFEGIEWN